MISSKTKIKDIINDHPEIKDKLIARNKRFKRLNNPIVFNLVGRFATIKDAARVSGEDLEELLHFLNAEITQ